MMFYDWMIAKYLGKDSWRGYLAGTMKYDEAFEEMNRRQDLLRHLAKRQACGQYVKVFMRCWQEYAREMRTQEIASFVQSARERRRAGSSIPVILEMEGKAGDRQSSDNVGSRTDASKAGSPDVPKQTIVWLPILTDEDLRRIRLEPLRCRGLGGRPG